MTRRAFLSAAAAAAQTAAPSRPNVVLIISDDQGYGDLSIHGNPHLQTPNIDQIAREGAQFTQFQVCPVCSPTRASLLTGRYNYRTGIVDTFKGRSMMDPGSRRRPSCLARPGTRRGSSASGIWAITIRCARTIRGSANRWCMGAGD